MGRNTIVAQEQLFMPRFREGRLGVKKYHSKEILFFLSSVEKVVSWDGFDVTDKKTELTAAVVGSFFFVQPSPSQDESVHGDWGTGMLPPAYEQPDDDDGDVDADGGDDVDDDDDHDDVGDWDIGMLPLAYDDQEDSIIVVVETKIFNKLIISEITR